MSCSSMTVDLMTAVYLNKQRRAAEAKADGDIDSLMELSLQCLEIASSIYILSQRSAELNASVTPTTTDLPQEIDHEMMVACGVPNEQVSNVIRMLTDEPQIDERLLSRNPKYAVN
ncbi:MAG: hypothetical protein AB8B94_07875 [Hyphomicrobiales bacterium]